MQPRTQKHERTGQSGRDASDQANDVGNPLHHTQKMSTELSHIIDHLRRDIDEIEEPQCKAMFETAVEVIGGLVTAFRHYEQHRESAWQATKSSAGNI